MSSRSFVEFLKDFILFSFYLMDHSFIKAWVKSRVLQRLIMSVVFTHLTKIQYFPLKKIAIKLKIFHQIQSFLA